MLSSRAQGLQLTPKNHSHWRHTATRCRARASTNMSSPTPAAASTVGVSTAAPVVLVYNNELVPCGVTSGKWLETAPRGEPSAVRCYQQLSGLDATCAWS